MIPKNKAVKILQHIYHETHPDPTAELRDTQVLSRDDIESQDDDDAPTVTSSQASQSSTASMESEGVDIPEESILHLGSLEGGMRRLDFFNFSTKIDVKIGFFFRARHPHVSGAVRGGSVRQSQVLHFE